MRFRINKPRWRMVMTIYFGPLILLGSFFYLRNIILFGSPFYPMELEVFGATVFPGLYKTDAFRFTLENSWLTLAQAILELEPLPRMDSFYAGLGPQLVLLAIPAVVAFLLSEKNRRGLIAVVWLLPLLVSVASLPAKYPRYLFHISIFLLPFAAWLLDNVSLWKGRFLKVIGAFCVLYSVFIAVPVYPAVPNDYEAGMQSVWSVDRMRMYGHFNKLRELSSVKGGPLRIATGYLRMTYPLLGERWQNEVIYIKPTSEEEWIEGLTAADIDVFAIDDTLDFSAEAEWIARHPELFVPYKTEPLYHVYLFVAGESGEHRSFITHALAEGGLR